MTCQGFFHRKTHDLLWVNSTPKSNKCAATSTCDRARSAKILFATQPSTAPPRFVLFTSGPLEASYRRFLERRLREQYGFAGTPIELSVKAREKRGAPKRR